MKHKAFIASTACLVVVLLSGGGCKLFQKTEPVVIQPPEITVSPTNPAKKVFKDNVGQFSFEYPGSWINEIQDPEDILTVYFYKNEKDKKDGVPAMVFSTPMYDTGYELMEVIQKKTFTTNNGKGSLEYYLIKPCHEQPNKQPCKVQKQGGFVTAAWSKDKNAKNSEGDYKSFKYKAGEFRMDLSLITNEVEEQRMLATFNEVIKSFKFSP